MLSSSYYDVWFFVGLLQCGVFHRLVTTLYLCMTNSDRQNGFDQLKISYLVIGMLKNESHRYSSYYIIKFLGFILIYYAINMDIVSSFMVSNNLYLGSIALLQVCINKIIFPLKKHS